MKNYCSEPPCPSVKLLMEGITRQLTFTNSILVVLLVAIVGFGVKSVGGTTKAEAATSVAPARIAKTNPVP